MSLITSACNIVDHWTIQYDDLNDRPYDVDMDDHIITIHNFGLSHHRLKQSPYFGTQADLALVEAQYIAHHMELLDQKINHYDADMVILMGRIMIADIQVQKIYYAYDQKSKGYDRAWKSLLCSDAMDMVQKFDHALTHFTSVYHDQNISMHHAMAACFHAWFDDNQRVEICDFETLSMMDDLLDDDVIFGSQKPTFNDVTCLTLTSWDQRSYLDRELQKDLLQNPFYREVKNDIHETYLKQIKADNGKTFIGDIGFSDSDLAQKFI